MAQTTVRITERSHQLLREISRSEKRPMQAILERALEDYRRRCFLEDVNTGWSDPEIRRTLREELGPWESVTRDGLAPVPKRKKPDRGAPVRMGRVRKNAAR